MQAGWLCRSSLVLLGVWVLIGGSIKRKRNSCIGPLHVISTYLYQLLWDTPRRVDIRGRLGLRNVTTVKATHRGQSMRTERGRAVTEVRMEVSGDACLFQSESRRARQAERLELVPEGPATTTEQPTLGAAVLNAGRGVCICLFAQSFT